MTLDMDHEMPLVRGDGRQERTARSMEMRLWLETTQ